MYSQTLTTCPDLGPCGTGTFRAHVLCVTANGSVATVGANVFQSDLATIPPGSDVLVTVYDNERGGDPAPDMVSFIQSGPVLESGGQCLNGPFPPRFTMVDGDIMVRDGQLVGGP